MLTRRIEMYATTLALLCCTASICRALEEPAPERLLLPRNFNPHPYQARGPVLFPTSEPTTPTAAPVVTVAAPPRPVTLQDLDGGHPYAKIVRKQKLRLNIQEEDNRISPQVYGALARHAHKVLHKSLAHHQIPSTVANTPPQLHDPTFSNQKKDYTFSYIVQDRHTGDDFSHSQSQDAKTTTGEYRVKLPDGRLQIVSYSADKNGYKADVKYDTGNELVTEIPVHRDRGIYHQVHQQHNVPQPQISVVSSTPTAPPHHHINHNILQPQNLQIAEGDYVEYNTPYYVPFVHQNVPQHQQLGASAGKLVSEDDISVYQNQVSRPHSPQQHFILSDKFQLYSTGGGQEEEGQDEEDAGQKLQVLPQFPNIAVAQKGQINHGHSSNNGYSGQSSTADLQRYSQVYFSTPNQHVHHQQNHGYY